MTIKKIVAVMVLGSLLGCAAHEQTPGQPLILNPTVSLDRQIGCASCVSRPVTPGQLFVGADTLLTIHAPNTDGWNKLGIMFHDMAFEKRGSASNESYTAQVITFDLPPTKNHTEFVSYVKQRIAAENPPPRYQKTESNYQYTERRGYPCVKAHTIFTDNDERFRSLEAGPIKLQIIGLYCRHPVQKQWGFSAIYKHRGSTLDPQLEAPAQSFIDGVTVPNNESNNTPPK